MGIINQLFDLAEVPVEKRQSINDAADKYLQENFFRLFAVSKRHLLESILEDMDGKHPEYHREVVESYLDDGC